MASLPCAPFRALRISKIFAILAINKGNGGRTYGSRYISRKCSKIKWATLPVKLTPLQVSLIEYKNNCFSSVRHLELNLLYPKAKPVLRSHWNLLANKSLKKLMHMYPNRCDICTLDIMVDPVKNWGQSAKVRNLPDQFIFRQPL